MYFTSGQNRAFERLMQEKPGFRSLRRRRGGRAGGLGLHPIWEYGARENGDFLLVNSTHLERHYGGDRIKHSHTPPTMREKP